MQKRVVLFSILILALPLFAEAAGAPKTFKDLAAMVYQLLEAGIATIVALGLVYFLWGIASNMTKLGEGDPSAFRAYVFWGVIILFVMVSIGGIVNLLGSTIFQSGGQSTVQPASSANVIGP